MSLNAAAAAPSDIAQPHLISVSLILSQKNKSTVAIITKKILPFLT
jgi:hypothetical protein